MAKGPKALLARAGALIAIALSLMAVPALADDFVPAAGGWQTYVNARYGTRVDFPASVFTPTPPPENGDGRRFNAADAAMEVYSFHNTMDETPASLEARLTGGKGYRNVTYSPRGNSWLVLSGFRGDTIFYEKYFFRGGVISGFGMEFPKARKPFYAPMIERMEDSFRAGRAD
ncbi:hypothetical protein [Afifella sp. IM 167]|uniref:hypothetical protein n=1 Tax=Afifella sp. IM 167 TaxID=2033586 RepID=UPI001CCD5BAB|nr:hypothetical protein [Afifella sp. IM 167]MBZ8133957.1 hypothetical protein [Afifella sp. IM 167]